MEEIKVAGGVVKKYCGDGSDVNMSKPYPDDDKVLIWANSPTYTMVPQDGWTRVADFIPNRKPGYIFLGDRNIESKLRRIPDDHSVAADELLNAGAIYYTYTFVYDGGGVCHIEYFGYTADLPEFDIRDGVLVGYYGKGGKVVIPDGVTAIDDEVFDRDTTIIDVTIPKSVTKIGHRAFAGCYNLTTVLIPDSIEEMKEEAFAGCSSLANVTMSNTVPLGVRAFDGCPCEFDVRNARKSITLQTTYYYAFYSPDNGWDYSLAGLIDQTPEDLPLDCTLSEFLADPETYFDENVGWEYYDLEEQWDEHELEKDEDVKLIIEFFDPYYGDELLDKYIIASVEYLYSDFYDVPVDEYEDDDDDGYDDDGKY